VDGIWVIGNHGFEVVAPGSAPAVRHDVSPFVARLVAAAARVSDIARGKPGVIVEDKRWTLSIHYRLAHPRIVAGLTAEIATVARETGLRLTHGKEVLELRPPVDIDKGTAAIELAQTLGALHAGASLVCAGDDRTDEDMFRGVRARQPAAVTVHVGANAGASETAAEFVVEDTDQMRTLLALILEQRRAAVGAD
jgi:trehalose-phosphatase